MTLTVKIFQDTAPYANSYQTAATRLLFVCSVGMLRSPTAANAATALGFNARAVGSDVDCALIPISVNLINWANHIIFVNHDNYIETLKHFEPVGYADDIKAKAVIWDIDDDYKWGDTTLFNIASNNLNKMIDRSVR